MAWRAKMGTVGMPSCVIHPIKLAGARASVLRVPTVIYVANAQGTHMGRYFLPIRAMCWKNQPTMFMDLFYLK